MEQRYSIAIVGCGPAGLSAALNARIRKKSLILFGEDGVSSKVSRPASISNYLGMPSVSGEELKSAFLQHIRQMGITITNARIDGIYPMGDYFVLSSGGRMYEAKTVILAMGAKATNPIPGEQQLLGSGVSYCATCDGMVYEGKTVAVAAYSEQEEDDVRYLAKIAKKVIFLPQYGSSLAGGNIETVAGKPAGVKKADGRLCLSLANGETVLADGVFLLPGCADLWNPKTVRSSMGAVFSFLLTIDYPPSGVTDFLFQTFCSGSPQSSSAALPRRRSPSGWGPPRR